MSKEDFLKSIDVRDFKPEEEFDGVTVVHTGRLDDENQEVLEMYDANGNRFNSNCSSLKKAEKLVAKLKEEGKDAVIGPEAPWRGEGGKLTRSRSKDVVGVYIVKQKEEKEVEEEKEPAE